jgi:ADP-ribose pyrophosphatase YjhB (NUDIX family)
MFCSACGNTLSWAPPTRCPACGVHHWNDAKPCASALVVVESRVMLVQRAQNPWKGYWDVPGGFCDAGEHPVRTAEREVLEETGIRIQVVGFLGIWLDEYPTAADASKRTLNIYYHARPSGSATAAPDRSEIADLRFFDASDFPEALAFPGHVPEALEAWKRAAAAGQLTTALFDRLRA